MSSGRKNFPSLMQLRDRAAAGNDAGDASSEKEDLDESIDNRPWTKTDELKLIDLLKKQRVLWHRKDPYYYARGDRKDKARAAMGKLLQRSEFSVARKLKQLVSQYQVERKKPFPSFKYFDKMRFLDVGKGYAAETPDEEEEEPETRRSPVITSAIRAEARPASRASDGSGLIARLMDGPPPPKRELIDIRSSPPWAGSPIPRGLPPPPFAPPPFPSRDEASIFGDLVAARLRSMPPSTRAAAQLSLLTSLNAL